jgi:hypothetical protein
MAVKNRLKKDVKGAGPQRRVSSLSLSSHAFCIGRDVSLSGEVRVFGPLESCSLY